MSVEMPVMNRHIVMASGSRYKLAATWRLPTEIQSNKVTDTARLDEPNI